MSWSRAFHLPIHLPDGRVLRTLRDAGEYIQELPTATNKRPEWQIAAEMLLEAAAAASVAGETMVQLAEVYGVSEPTIWRSLQSETAAAA